MGFAVPSSKARNLARGDAAPAASRAGATGEAKRPPIPALTGIRAVAALWVVAFHYEEDILRLVPALHPVQPLLGAGYLGVDVFFALSGFILAYNYATSMQRFDKVRTLGFLRNRLARVYPVHFVTLNANALQSLAAAALGLTAAGAGNHLHTPAAYVQNVTLTQAWFSDRLSFNGPAWSISAEWAAYLATPLLLLALARVHRARSAVMVSALAYVGMLSYFAAFAASSGNAPHGALIRIAAEFTAGVFLFRVYERIPAVFGRLVEPAAAGILLAVFLIPAATAGDYWLAPLFAVLVLGLAYGRGPVARVLASRWFVFWGEASFALYMTHMLLQPALKLVLPTEDIAGSALPVRLLVAAVYVAALGAAAVVVYRFVEVLGRRWLKAPRRARATITG